MKKRLLAICLTLFVLLQSSLISIPVMAASTATLSADTITADAGDTVKVTLKINSNPGLTFLKIRLSYDTNVLTLFGAYNGNVIKDMTSGKAYVWSTANTSYATGTLATFIFTVKPGAKQGSYPITFTCSEASNGENDVSVPAVTGTIKVNCVHNMKETSHTEATCKATGKSVMKCTECSYTETITFDKVDCSPVNEATCEDAFVCEYCGETLEKALGHAYRSETVEPTTSSEGYTLHTCMRCGDEYVDDVVPPIIEHEHTFVRQQVVKPTCTKEGYTLYQCSDSNCGETKKENIVSATGHKYTSKVTAPTCTAQGYTTHTCSCGDSYKDSYTSALGHNYVNRTCTRCGDTIEYSIGLKYTSNGDGTCYVSGIGTCTDTKIVIPSTYNGMKVTSIGSHAFAYCSNLTSVNIPSGVTSIDSYAFAYSTSLTSVNIPSSVTSISEGIFRECSGLVNIGIPSSVTSIGNGAFFGCSNLTSVNIPSSVTSIGNYVFRMCSSLTSINISSNVISIGAYAFESTNLKDIYYDGTKTQWALISIGSDHGLDEVTIHYLKEPVHTHSYTTKVTAPTCTAQGYTTYTCSCGDSYKDTYTAATGHSCSFKTTKTPTTSATGTLTGTCSKCNGTTTVTLPKLSTTDYNYTVTKVATCTATGTGKYTWKTTTYGKFDFTVSNPATGHQYVNGTCTRCGAKDPSFDADENVPMIVVDNATATHSSTFKLKVKLENNSGLINMNLSLKYDNAALKLVSVENGKIFDNLMLGQNYLFYSNQDEFASDVLCTMTFEVLSTAVVGDYTIEIICHEATNQAEKDVLVASGSGKIAVNNILYGDANGDGMVNAKDLTRLSLYLANYDYSTEQSSVEIGAGGDATGDGRINAKDLSRLCRYLAFYDYSTGKSSVALGPNG